MSIWGKIIGGAAGFALGGPLGALLGALAGHAVDRHRQQSAPAVEGPETGDERLATRQAAFTIGVIALGAKMAKADGHVSRAEIAAFKDVFRIPPEELKNVARVFDLAKRSTTGFEDYARQIARLFKPGSAVLEELLDGLFHIAMADGAAHEAELAYLARVAEIFGFGAADFARIRESHLGPDEADPYRILGVSPDADPAAIKAAWKKLVRENHPDRLIGKGMPPEFVALATEKLAAINAAYDRIAKERNIV